MSTGASTSGPFAAQWHVINLGVEMFAEELERQQVPVVRVEWRPPTPAAEQAYQLLPELED